MFRTLDNGIRMLTPRDCWLDPYGNVYYVESFKHNDFAEQQLQDEFPADDPQSWADDPNFFGSYQETLERRGWVRFTTTMNRWSCEHCIDFEMRYPRPTKAQMDKMFDLTGFNYEDPNSWSKF